MKEERMPNNLDPQKWVKNYSDNLLRFAFLRTGNNEQAKDLVQETFLAALRNAETYKGDISEKNWLYFILKNKIIDHYRKKAASLVTEIDALLEKSSDYFDEAGHWKEAACPKEWGVNYSDPVEKEEFYEILNKCTQKLSELIRIVFTMKYIDEKESEEICKELQITSSNYWVIIHRAKLQVRKCLEKNWISI